MPKSKRDRVVSLTQTKKKSYETKQKLVEEIQACCEKYRNIYVIETKNERNNLLKDVRDAWKHSRLFLGRNKVMAIAIGRTKESELKEELCKVSQCLRGRRGLLFSNESLDSVRAWFKKHSSVTFARSGSLASETVKLHPGPIDLPHPMEPQLRQLGLPTKLKDGEIVLEHEHVICEAGKPLTTQSATILKHLGNCMAEFHIEVIAQWSEGTFLQLSDSNMPMEEDDRNSNSENEQ